jgi:hypothetical protein
MAKTVSAIKRLIKREERTLLKLKETLSIMAHKESKALLKGFMTEKKAAIKAYKAMLERASRCPAVMGKAVGKKTAK